MNTDTEPSLLSRAGVSAVPAPLREYTLHEGHVLDRLAELQDESIHCIVTSPPYWGLRDYKLEPVVWGGDAGCEHQWRAEARGFNAGRSDHGTGDPRSKLGPNKDGLPGGTDQGRGAVSQGTFCLQCGAWRGSLGLEPTPELYVEHLVAVFRELRRVLRSDGVCWLNLGDTYYNGDKWGGGGANTGKHTRGADGTPESWKAVRRKWGDIAGLKPKDLVMIPARVALALQADGWWLRSDIIWHKPNPMPESVRDRPTKAHEMIYLLTKSERYRWDQEAVREPISESQIGRVRSDVVGGSSYTERGQHSKGGTYRTAPLQGSHGTPGHDGNGMRMPDKWNNPAGRNIRSVWTISTAPFPEAHFATFPPALVEPMVKAGCPEDGTVLDPFAGAGTTGLVALRLGRKFIGIEANPEYLEMARRRIQDDAPMFNNEVR